MNANDKNLQLSISTSRGTKEFSFPKQTKVADVIHQVVTAFGFASGDRLQLVLASNPEEALQPERTLVSYHLTDGTKLILTAVGSGV
jgi:hypothetical protein